MIMFSRHQHRIMQGLSRMTRRAIAADPVRALAAAGAIVAAALMVSACAMSQSTLVTPKDPDGCQSSAGAYSLSKSYIAFDIHREGTGVGNGFAHYMRVPTPDAETKVKAAGLELRVKPDPEYTYCLDYLSSVTSADTFSISKKDHILTNISTVADDQSTKIVSNLVKTLFVGLSGNAGFDPNNQGQRNLSKASIGSTLVFSGVVDPFDHEDVNRTNDAIRQFGYCIFMEGEPIDPGHDDVEAYCENPMGWSRHNLTPKRQSNWRETAARSIDRAGQTQAPRKYSQGIFYRPRMPVTYYLYVKDNLKLKNVRDAWKLRGTATAMMENAAPVLSVGVDRTFFAKRETTLVFDAGVLQDVTIKKGSELANFSTIPLQVAQSVVALPANIIQVKINTANNEANLIAAQDSLIKARRDLAADRLAAANQTPLPGTAAAESFAAGGGGVRNLSGGAASNGSGGGNPNAVCFTQCMAGTGVSEPSCTRYCTCRIAQCVSQGYDDNACSKFCGQPGQ